MGWRSSIAGEKDLTIYVERTPLVHVPMVILKDMDVIFCRVLYSVENPERLNNTRAEQMLSYWLQSSISCKKYVIQGRIRKKSSVGYLEHYCNPL